MINWNEGIHTEEVLYNVSHISCPPDNEYISDKTDLVNVPMRPAENHFLQLRRATDVAAAYIRCELIYIGMPITVTSG